MNDALTLRFEEVRQLTDSSDELLLIKKIIDFTLDTEDVQHYTETVCLLDWLDANSTSLLRKEKLITRLDQLHADLRNKQLPCEDLKLLETQNLAKKYPKGNFSLGPIDMSLHRRQIIGLVGENGNGKTTLLRLLCGELQPTAGKIEYNLPYKNQYTLRTKLVYIPQRTPTWRGSILSNLQFTAAAYGIKGKKNELLVELLIARLGLRKYREYAWKDLSSGYKMRFELTRSLLRDPQVLLIDEPLANLDIIAQQTILDDLKNIANSLFRPIGIILSSQQLYEVEKTSDDVIFLKEGVPRNLTNSKEQDIKLIIEFESSFDQLQLKQILSQINLENFYINGGTYIAVFPGNITQTDFLQIVLKQQIPLIYFRNISNSTRRFFLS